MRGRISIYIYFPSKIPLLSDFLLCKILFFSYMQTRLMSYRLQSRAFEHLVPSGLSRPPFFWQLWSHTHKPHLLFCVNVYVFSCFLSIVYEFMTKQEIKQHFLILAQSRPMSSKAWQDRQGKVCIGVFSASHFAPTVLGSDWILLLKCGYSFGDLGCARQGPN